MRRLSHFFFSISFSIKYTFYVYECRFLVCRRQQFNFSIHIIGHKILLNWIEANPADPSQTNVRMHKPHKNKMKMWQTLDCKWYEEITHWLWIMSCDKRFQWLISVRENWQNVRVWTFITSIKCCKNHGSCQWLILFYYGGDGGGGDGGGRRRCYWHIAMHCRSHFAWLCMKF